VKGEKQLTFDARGHQLTNINVWTADSQWLVYDVRPHGGSFTGETIERVNVSSGEIEVLYQAGQGAHVGVVTVSSEMPPRYAFIHGPEHPDEQWHYDFHHRRGVILSPPAQQPRNLDAMDITPPFTDGALRGGSHVHVFSPDGSRLSFTYNDHLMHELDTTRDLRNVGVALASPRPVLVDKQHPREYDGSHFCVLVSQTTSTPQPGSDQINRAYEECWIGQQGYINAEGVRQRWALAFIGDTLSQQGEKLPEIFVVDLPDADDDYRRAGMTPLTGTSTELPAPPKGVQQRRITLTGDRAFPGIALQPRHWLRASPDGSQIAFLMADDDGVVQLWVVSPNGGAPQQISHAPSSIQSAFSWRPDGKALAMICDNSVMVLELESAEMRRLTPRTDVAPCAEAVVFSPDGHSVAYMRNITGFAQIFVAQAG